MGAAGAGSLAGRGIPGVPLNICCAWFDEFSADASEHANGEGYHSAHQLFVEKRLKNLGKIAQREVRRRAEIKALPIALGQKRKAICDELAVYLQSHISTLHAHHHTVDPISQKRVSFGLIRMANIGPLNETAQALYAMGAQQDCHIHLCIYHSKHPLLVRSGIEKILDKVLNRKAPLALFNNTELRQRLDTRSESNQIFVVLATAVAEVGRDHDYDWAIVEPSSMRSIIQLAGRVRRHRTGSCETPNLYLLDTNVRHLEYGLSKPAFCRPGFEGDKTFKLNRHHLSELLTPEQLAVIDASTRIREREQLYPEQNLVDLEHARLRALMLCSNEEKELNIKPAHWWWTTNAAFSGELQRVQPFRHDPLGRQRYALLPNDDGEIGFYRFERESAPTEVNKLRHEISLDQGARISFWGEPVYSEALSELAEAQSMELLECARRFGIVDLPAKGVDNGWDYHPALGFSRRK